MPTYQFDHIHLNSPNALKTSQFYETMFGAKIVRVREMYGGTVVRLDLNGQQALIGPPVGKSTFSSSYTAASIWSYSLWIENR